MIKLSIQSKICLIASGCLLLANTVFAQTCKNDIAPTTPTSRFTVHNNGTVTDNKTGLIWQACSLGQTWQQGACKGEAKQMIWQGALNSAKTNQFLGLNDWRVPNIKELTSIAELACYSPAINLSVFPDTPSRRFWSSSSNANYIYYAWVVTFNDGHDDGSYFKNYANYVRLVRVGQ